MDAENTAALPFEERFRVCFGDMLVRKTPVNTKLFAEMNLPSFIRDWLIMRFSDPSGAVDEKKLTAYIKKTIPDKAQWNNLLVDMLYHNQTARFLAKVKIDFDMKKKQALFSLPAFQVPAHKGEAVVDWQVIEQHREELLSSADVWGIVSIRCESDAEGKSNLFKLIDFTPFCPYNIDLNYYVNARPFFSVGEWIDVVLSAMDYNPDGYKNEAEKTAVLKRLLPFVEKRVNLIELAPKETGKSYMFSRLSQYGWLISGGSISRAKMFYDIAKRTNGLVSKYDYVALDEISSIKFTDKMEMQGALKGYLESGDYHVGDYRGVGEAGMVLLGNISSDSMDTNLNMFEQLADFFRDSALLDRFHGFIKGWDIPKMHEGLKANGWALNTEYFVEILHALRSRSVYRSVVDRLIEVEPNAAVRDTEAIKRLSTAYLKLLFPHVTEPDKIDPDEFRHYCLEPAMEMRGVIKTQLGIIDPGEFGGKTIPAVTLREEA